MNTKRLGDGFGRGHEPEAFELGGRGEAARLGRIDRHARKTGRVFVLEVEAAGDARGAAGGGIGARAFPEPPGKILVGSGCQRHPGLKITGRSFEREKRRGGEGREAIGLEIVELNEADIGAVWPHDDVALLGGSKIEHPWQLALELRERHVATEQFLIAGARRPRHIEMRGADAGKEIEHPLPVM
jgi:hypothetical protein